MNRSMPRPVRSATLALVLAVTCGCTGSLLKSQLPAAQIYRLAPLPAEGTPAAPLDAVVLVPRPVAAPGLDTERIAVLRDGQRLDYFSASRWGAALPDVVQEVVVESLQNSGRLRSVQRELGNFRADFLLQLDVRAFQAEYTRAAHPVAHVDLVATLGRPGDRASVHSFVVSASEPATANTMTAVAAAFDSALRKVTRTVAANAIDYIGQSAENPATTADPPAPR